MTDAPPAFVPTHVVPDGGLSAWDRPDAQAPPGPPLGGRLPVMVFERSGDWAHIRCSNGWEAWTDGRALVEDPSANGADAELIARLQASLSTFTRLLDDLEANRIDADAFRSQAFAAGLIVRDDEAWLWDFAKGRWFRYDGLTLSQIEMTS